MPMRGVMLMVLWECISAKPSSKSTTSLITNACIMNAFNRMNRDWEVRLRPIRRDYDYLTLVVRALA